MYQGREMGVPLPWGKAVTRCPTAEPVGLSPKPECFPLSEADFLSAHPPPAHTGFRCQPSVFRWRKHKILKKEYATATRSELVPPLTSPQSRALANASRKRVGRPALVRRVCLRSGCHLPATSVSPRWPKSVWMICWVSPLSGYF